MQRKRQRRAEEVRDTSLPDMRTMMQRCAEVRTLTIEWVCRLCFSGSDKNELTERGAKGWMKTRLEAYQGREGQDEQAFSQPSSA